MPSRRPSLRDRPVLPAVGRAAADDLLMGAERRRQEVQELPLDEIMPNRRQPRASPSDEGLAELSASIGEHGVLQPILVQAVSLRAYEGRPCRYELIAGERRWRASRLAGRETIPAIVLGEAADERQLLLLALIENLQREGLHPLDEGRAFAQLQADFGLSQQEIAERVGKSRGYVQNRLRLMAAPEDLRQLAAERPDSIAHIYEIARLDDPQARAELLAAVRDDRISHAETRARVTALLAPPDVDLRKSTLGAEGGGGEGEIDLRKSTLGAEGEGGEGEIDLRKSTLRAEGGGGEGEIDLRKSTLGAEGFLSPAERTALATVIRRLEAAAIPEGDDLALLVRLSALVAALQAGA